MAQEEKYYAVSHSPVFRPLLKRKAGALLVHWVFQGILNMDSTERAFKLGYRSCYIYTCRHNSRLPVSHNLWQFPWL